MAAGRPELWMWAEACEVLARAERMQRHFFQPRPSRLAPAWEPPVDIIETGREVLIFVALPGVEARDAEAVIEGGELVVRGLRTIPPELADALIHRLELPQGRYERRLPLPPGRYDDVRREVAQGCLVVRLHKA